MPAKRVKDAGFLQQHIEKLLLAVGALVLLVSVFLFVMGNPFALEIDGRTFDDPDEAVGTLVANNSTIESGLNDPSPLPNEIVVPEFLEEIELMLDKDVDANRVVEQFADSGLTLKAMYPDIPLPPRYVEVTPPTPTDIAFTVGTDVLDVGFLQQKPAAFFELWGGERDPADFTMIIVAGEFSMWDWANRLKEAPEQAGMSKIPTGIWTQRFGVTGTGLLREEFDPVSGLWIDRRIVAALPTQARVFPEDPMPSDTAIALNQLAQLREAQARITQPELPWLSNFVQATPPGGEELREGAEGFDAFGNPLGDKNLGPAEAQIEQLKEKITALQERKRLREERKKPRGGGDGGGIEDFSSDAGQSSKKDPIARNIEQLQRRIAGLQPKADIERAQRELAAKARAERAARENLLGPRGNPGGFGENPEDLVADGIGLKEGQTIRVWAADPTMQPGKTYRYKLLVAAINPLYAIQRLDPKQLEENQSTAALLPTQEEIDAMEWIGPVTVEPELRFFITRGTQDLAKVDIYRRVNGYLAKHSFDVLPGDNIGGVVEVNNPAVFPPNRMVDMRVGAVLVDIEARRNSKGESTFVMICLDSDGNLFERSLAKDSTDPARRKLDIEISDGPEWALRPKLDVAPGGEIEDFREFDF